jgi:hypothetical protein
MKFSVRIKTDKAEHHIPLHLIGEEEHLQTLELWMEEGEILPLLIFPFTLNEQGYVRRAPYEDEDS